MSATSDVLTPQELSELLKVPVSTLHRWSSQGTGPRPARVGKHLRWIRAEVDRWLEEQMVRPT